MMCSNCDKPYIEYGYCECKLKSLKKENAELKSKLDEAVKVLELIEDDSADEASARWSNVCLSKIRTPEVKK